MSGSSVDLTREVWDAVVVGSGAAGGWIAHELTARGVRTLLLEAGRPLDLDRDFAPPPDGGASKIQLQTRARAFLTGQHVQARCMSYSRLTRHLFVNDRENPYTTPSGAGFNWYRSRVLGGRMHLWGRNAVRIADEDFSAPARDGHGIPWPIGYAELAPWYERVERFIGVHGTSAGIANLPDGIYDGPHATTRAEAQLLATLAARWPSRPATTSRIVRHNPARIPTTIMAALATGRLTLRANAVVSRIEVDDATGRANGVTFVDRTTHTTYTVRARTVLLGASAIESLRILLNSTSRAHPKGLGNSADLLGRGLSDHVMVFQAGPYEPLEPGVKGDPFDFGAQTGIYIPSFRNRLGDRPQDNFLRGYSMLGSVGRIAPGWFFMAVGEMLPYSDNRVELDPRRRDAWGIPVAKITCRHTDNERAMIRDMSSALQQLAHDCGLAMDTLGRESLLSRLFHRVASPLVYTPEGALLPGSAIHEAGGAPMGRHRGESVLDANASCWDAPNVYVTDAAAFTTSPFQNPALTIMALSARAANDVADRMLRREL